MIRKIFSGLILVLFWPLVVYPYGLSTPAGQVWLENLRIGGTYSMTDLFKYPLKLNYDGDTAVKLTIEVVVPSTNSVWSGYEPIPDKNWISVDKTEFFLNKENNEAITDVKITIPDDKSLMGKKFEVWLHSVVVPTNMTGLIMGAGVNSRFMISIADRELSPEEKKQLEQKQWRAFTDFELTPTKNYLDVTPGKPVRHKIKLVNKSDEKVVFEIKKIIDTNANPQANYQPLPGEIKVKLPGKIVLAPNSIKEIDFLVDFPKKEYPDKFYSFWIEVTPQIKEIVQFSLRSGVFITVK